MSPAASARPGWLRESVAGTLGTLSTLVVPLTLGMLALAPLGAHGAAAGVLAGLTTTVVGGVLFGLLGRSVLPTAGPSSATALILAALVLRLATDPAMAGDAVGHAARSIGVAGCAVLLSGLVQVAIALLGMARLARHVPQPVLAGFMNGVALLVCIGQLPLLLGQVAGTPLAASLAQWQPWAGALCAATVVLALGMAWRWKRLPASVLALLLATAVFHGVQAAWPSAGLGRVVGTVPDGLSSPLLLWPLASEAGHALLQRHAVAIVSTALALAVVGAMESALNALAVDRARNTWHEPGRELLAIGITNVVGGLFCSLPAVALRARAQAVLNAGGQGARAAIGGSLAIGVLALLGGHWLSWLPLPALAGIMLIVAWSLVDRWTLGLLVQWWKGQRSRALHLSLALVALVCVVTVWQGFVVAVAVGMLLSMLLFIARMNRSLVRSRYTAAARPSRRIYPADVELRLQPLRSQVLVLELEGPLFFGSSDRLMSDAQLQGGLCSCVVLGLARVGDIDETGVLALQLLQDRLQRQGVALRLAGVLADSPRAQLLRSFGCSAELWPDADHATEAAERQLLGAQGQAALAGVALADSSLLQGITGAAQALVLQCLQPQRLQPGEVLFEAGSTADGLYVLTEGSVSVVGASSAGAGQHRYLSLSPGMMFGETAMLDGRGRSAAVVADDAALVHRLALHDLQALSARHPELAALMYRNIALHLSQRLRSAAAAWEASVLPSAGSSGA
jgi:MFS superfamily sulfate permease-like transporter